MMRDIGLARPLVTLKLATSLDGRIATRSGASQWITGPEARARVHEMRAAHDCILTGIGTVLADDPLMTARTTPQPARQPVRAVLDSKGRTPVQARLLTTASLGPVCLFQDRTLEWKTETGNVQRFGIDHGDGGLDISQVLFILASQLSIKSVMVEAGSGVASSFLRAGLVDRLVWFRAPKILGGDGMSVFTALGVDVLSQAIICKPEASETCGEDVMETYTVSTRI